MAINAVMRVSISDGSLKVPGHHTRQSVTEQALQIVVKPVVRLLGHALILGSCFEMADLKNTRDCNAISVRAGGMGQGAYSFKSTRPHSQLRYLHKGNWSSTRLSVITVRLDDATNRVDQACPKSHF